MIISWQYESLMIYAGNCKGLLIMITVSLLITQDLYSFTMLKNNRNSFFYPIS